MRVGVMILPEQRWPHAVKNWRRAEELGFDSAWTYDHLSWGPLQDKPWFSAFLVLTAAASATERIRLGTLVTSPNFRHPVMTSKDAMTLDDISGGRFTLGIGAGSTGAGDAHVIDEAPLSRHDRTLRFEEFVELTDLLLRNPVVSHSGRFFSAHEARNVPACVQQPRLPLAIAATGARGFSLAARHGDAWVTCGPPDLSRSYPPDELLAITRGQVDSLRTACQRTGRDMTEIDRIFVVTDMSVQALRSGMSFVEFGQAYAAIGITHLVVHSPRAQGIFANDPRMLDRIAEHALPRLRDL